ncbi:YkgJ family cysteine cluster protein [Desulfatirhabdium butyrativorans]|uniref:YkgJ family cysteine cluster protein n=1 Tax=Desulfatirhabdium butyrativorans TaxID=340467 RepID=UPI000429C592|nr:YkgJ family cysteine cluster protein [Desulfatirhabdium butyrativorans]
MKHPQTIESIEAALAPYRNLIERIDAICRTITKEAGAAITCHDGCDACCEAIGVLPVEAVQIARHLDPSRLPDWEKIHGIMQHSESTPTASPCPFLHQHRCRIYPVRPLICRTQGMAFLVEEEGEKRLVHCPRNFGGMSRFPAAMLIDLDRMNEYLIRINDHFLQEVAARLPERIPLAEILRWLER